MSRPHHTRKHGARNWRHKRSTPELILHEVQLEFHCWYVASTSKVSLKGCPTGSHARELIAAGVERRETLGFRRLVIITGRRDRLMHRITVTEAVAICIEAAKARHAWLESSDKDSRLYVLRWVA